MSEKTFPILFNSAGYPVPFRLTEDKEPEPEPMETPAPEPVREILPPERMLQISQTLAGLRMVLIEAKTRLSNLERDMFFREMELTPEGGWWSKSQGANEKEREDARKNILFNDPLYRDIADGKSRTDFEVESINNSIANLQDERRALEWGISHGMVSVLRERVAYHQQMQALNQYAAMIDADEALIEETSEEEDDDEPFPF